MILVWGATNRNRVAVSGTAAIAPWAPGVAESGPPAPAVTHHWAFRRSGHR
jgi:hypothetical protein